MPWIITPKAMRAQEAEWIASGRVTGYELMERAARAVADAALQMTDGGVLFFLGPGNNAGDGYAAARMLHEAGRKVHLWSFAPLDGLPKDARRNMELCRQAGLRIETKPILHPDSLPEGIGLFVDALFGTGLSRQLPLAYEDAIYFLNAWSPATLAIDMPTGDDEVAVQAKKTITFHRMKTAHVFYPGRACAGEIEVAEIGLPDVRGEGEYWLLDDEIARYLLIPRAPDAHKGTCGHALIAAGSYGMAGAAALCTEAAIRAGAGLVTALCPAEIIPILQTLVPCAMAQPFDKAGKTPDITLERVLPGKTAAAVGPGLGRGKHADLLLKTLRAAQIRQVWDADALNWLSSGQDIHLGAQFVITPHPGEAARLLNMPTADILKDPIAAADALHGKTGATVVLKGATTVIIGSDPRMPVRRGALHAGGSPGMATGGTGDVLTGLIAGFLAQGNRPFEAACAGVYHHGLAGVRAAELRGVRSMSAGDLLEAVRID